MNFSLDNDDLEYYRLYETHAPSISDWLREQAEQRARILSLRWTQWFLSSQPMSEVIRFSFRGGVPR